MKDRRKEKKKVRLERRRNPYKYGFEVGEAAEALGVDKKRLNNMINDERGGGDNG